MNYQKINEVLADLSEYRLSGLYTKIETTQSSDYYSEKDQGEVGTKEIIYKLDFDDLHLKVLYISDSYGENETIKSVQFVKAVKKEITVYEPVK